MKLQVLKIFVLWILTVSLAQDSWQSLHHSQMLGFLEISFAKLINPIQPHMKSSA
jgi:hypothetical protein